MTGKIVLSGEEYGKLVVNLSDYERMKAIVLELSFNKFAEGGFCDRPTLRMCGFTDDDMDMYAFDHGVATPRPEFTKKEDRLVKAIKEAK